MKKSITELLKLLPASFQSTYTYEVCKECHAQRSIKFYYELTIKGSSDAGMNNRSGSEANVYEIYYQAESLLCSYGHKPKKIIDLNSSKNRDLRQALEDFYNYVKKYHSEIFKNY